MALITCPECGGKISDKAKACIHCGYPLRESVGNSQSNKPKIDFSNPQKAAQQIDEEINGGKWNYPLPRDNSPLSWLFV